MEFTVKDLDVFIKLLDNLIYEVQRIADILSLINEKGNYEKK